MADTRHLASASSGMSTPIPNQGVPRYRSAGQGLPPVLEEETQGDYDDGVGESSSKKPRLEVGFDAR